MYEVMQLTFLVVINAVLLLEYFNSPYDEDKRFYIYVAVVLDVLILSGLLL